MSLKILSQTIFIDTKNIVSYHTEKNLQLIDDLIQ